MRNSGLRLVAIGIWMMLITALMTGCSNGFTTSPTEVSKLQCSNNCGNSGLDTSPGDGGGSNPAPAPIFNPEAYKGRLLGGSFDIQVINIDIPNKMIEFRLPMLANPILDGASLALPIPRIPGASLGLEHLPDGRSALVFKMPIAKYLEGINTLPPDKLPNGDRIPGVPDGELPSLALDINANAKIKATLYLAPTLVGIYINTPFNPFINLTLPIKNKDGRVLGYFSLIPAKVAPPAPVAHDGGFFISFALPADLARALASL